MKEEKCLIIENKNISKQYYLLTLETETIAAQAVPGNFVMLAASNSLDPLLKRPFGILDVNDSQLRLYYEIVGKGTQLIADLKPGDHVHAVGPLGNGFPSLEQKNILLVAGGRGIAPLFFSMDRYIAQNKVSLIYGARSGDDLNLLEELNKKGLDEIFLYTDDGSKGKKGFVTDDIKQIIKDKNIQVTVSCGPDAMFESLHKAIGDKKTGTENYLSMEALMGCGFGICHSCVIKDATEKYKKVCTDGPVFRMEDLAWEK